EGIRLRRLEFTGAANERFAAARGGEMAVTVQRPTGVVVDTSRSPACRLRPVPLAAVRLADEFWAPRLRINREVTLPSQYEQCEETGRIDNFRRAAGKKQGPFQGIYFNDSDVYKWAEAV